MFHRLNQAGRCEFPDSGSPDGPASSLARFRDTSERSVSESISGEDGKTWTEPISIARPHSVQPSLQVMGDGTVLLSGGRPGLFLWSNTDGSEATGRRSTC